MASPETRRRYRAYEKGQEAGEHVAKSRETFKKAEKEGLTHNKKMETWRLSDRAADLTDEGRSYKNAARYHRYKENTSTPRRIFHMLTGQKFNHDPDQNAIAKTINGAYSKKAVISGTFDKADLSFDEKEIRGKK